MDTCTLNSKAWALARPCCVSLKNVLVRRFLLQSQTCASSCEARLTYTIRKEMTCIGTKAIIRCVITGAWKSCSTGCLRNHNYPMELNYVPLLKGSMIFLFGRHRMSRFEITGEAMT